MAIRGNPERIFCEGVRWGDLSSATLEQLVGYFRIRVYHSIFDPVKKLLLPEYKTTGLMILAVMSSLIDFLSQYFYSHSGEKNKDKYKRFLREQLPEFRQPVSLKKFPHAKDLADFFYEGFRSQVLHNFMLTEYSTIGWKTDLVMAHVWDKKRGLQEIIVNPRLLTERLEAVFNSYLDSLLDPKQEELRLSFAKKLYLDTGVKINVT